MLNMKDIYYKDIEDEINNYFYQLYYAEIFEILKEDKDLRLNSKSYLLTAIRTGKVHYTNATFTGTFNAKISKELREFAKYDSKHNLWRGIAPPEIKAAAIVARSKGETLNQRIKAAIEKIPAKVAAMVDKFKYSIKPTMEEISKQADKELNSIGITAELTPSLSKRLTENYTNNQNKNIKNWSEKETERLRAIIEKNTLSGFNRNELKDLIQNEFGVTKNKAAFLARQETSLFLVEIRDNRYQDAGITKWKWSTSHDIRVRDEHNKLNGKIFTYSSPPIIDQRTGERGLPGQAYGCRCQLIPVI